MLYFKRFFRFYINASVHVALAVVSLCLISIKDFNIFVNFDLLGFVFFATIVCYNFVKYGVEADKYLIVSKPSHKAIQRFSFFAFGGCLYFFFQLPGRLWPIIVLLTIISVLYAIPFLPSSRNLRSWGGLKIFLIALIWTGFTVTLPIVDHDFAISQNVMIYGVQRFLLVLVLILPFEVRDMDYDGIALQTLPQRFGVGLTKTIGYVLIGMYMILALLCRNSNMAAIFFILLTSVLLALTMYKTTAQQGQYYASFWVEGIPIVLALLNYVMDWIMG